MRMLLRDTRHTGVMALWGRVWMWHAVQVFVLFLASNVLIWAGTRRAAPFVALWVIGLPLPHGPRLVLPLPRRARPDTDRAAARTGLGHVRRQLLSHRDHRGSDASGRNPAAAARGTSVRTGSRVHGHDPGGLILRSGCGVCGACSCTGRRAELGPAIFGVVFGIGLFVPGWRFSRRKPRARRATLLIGADFRSAGWRIAAAPQELLLPRRWRVRLFYD